MKLGINPITTNKMRLITNKIIQVDSKFKGVIENSHLCDIGMHRVKNSHFKTLVQSIISQQLATKAALKINERVCDLVNNKFKPEVILSLTPGGFFAHLCPSGGEYIHKLKFGPIFRA